MNMTYCRWHNTAHALLDCAEDLQDRADGCAREELSREEFEAACRLLMEAQSMLGTIRDRADIWSEADLTLDQIRDGMAKIETGASRYATDED